MRFLLTFLCIPLIFVANIQAQKKNAAFEYPIKQATSSLKVDGIIDEKAWQDATLADNFFMVLPMDTSRTNVKTEVRMTYDKDNVYIMATCYEGTKGDYVVESLRRDFNFGKNDNFIVFIDPFNDQTNGFAFGINAAGAQWDGMMYEGGKVDLSWDNKWYSKVVNYADRWVFEAAIPFKTIRYKSDVSQWGINFGRNDLKTTEKSAWAPVPRQFPTASLAYTGSLVWDNPPPQPSVNISVIPYALGSVSKDFVKNTKSVINKDIGGDAKIALGSSLNLDVTINPDFSQVEVDRQVTNLDRFELFFPERRQFFLENGDLFSNFGTQDVRPFFSRRIGLNTPIQFGARLSGKINEDLRIGAMTMQTGKVAANGQPSQNFSVLALHHKVQKRSNIGAFIINKQSLNYKPDAGSSLPKYAQYNRNMGVEYNLASSNNFWTGKALLMKSFSPNVQGKDIAQIGALNYNNRNWQILWEHQYVGKNFNAEVGYVPRTGYIKLSPGITYQMFPKSGKILSHGPSTFSFYYTTENFKKTENTNVLFYNVTFRDRNMVSAWIANDDVTLLRPFDPTNSNGATLTTGTRHKWKAFGTDFTSKPQSLFTYSFSTRYGGYYADGTRLNISNTIGYRFQPYVSLAVNTSYTDIRLPAPWGVTKFWLVGPRLDVTMTDKLFFTTFVQYNEQIKNVNVNTRLQWRYKPVSDLFIVYTDNYLPENFKVKNRALVLKLTYWWNV